jgi:hypothetical protein
MRSVVDRNVMQRVPVLPSFTSCCHLTAVWRTVLLSRDGAARLDRTVRYCSSGINLHCIEVGFQTAAHRLWPKLWNKRHFVKNKTDYAECLTNAVLFFVAKYIKWISVGVWNGRRLNPAKIDTLVMYIWHFILKLTQHNTSPLLSQPVDAVWGNNRFLLWKL